LAAFEVITEAFTHVVSPDASILKLDGVSRRPVNVAPSQFERFGETSIGNAMIHRHNEAERRNEKAYRTKNAFSLPGLS
jgi:hypothetical protein